MSSATPLPYEVRYNADTGTLQYGFQTGWIDISIGGGVTSVTGVANKVTVSPTTGDVVVTLPANITLSTSVTLPKLIGSASINIIAPAVDGVSAWKFTQADGSTVVMDVDTQNRRIGIGTSTPAKLLHVAGNTNIDGVLAMGPTNASAACLIDMVNPFVGLGVPAMTTAQKAAISPARAGNVVFDTDLGKLCVNNGAAWETITSA